MAAVQLSFGFTSVSAGLRLGCSCRYRIEHSSRYDCVYRYTFQTEVEGEEKGKKGV